MVSISIHDPTVLMRFNDLTESRPKNPLIKITYTRQCYPTKLQRIDPCPICFARDRSRPRDQFRESLHVDNRNHYRRKFCFRLQYVQHVPSN